MELLKDKLAMQGSAFFRTRSFLPLLLVVPAIAALSQSGYVEQWFGEATENLWDVFCVFVAFVGLALRIATVGFVPAGTSGRNTSEQRADTLNTSGLYSVVRNPLYLGNVITLVGFLLAIKVWWFVLVILPITMLFYERIILAEEAYLAGKFGRAYEIWVARTPAFMPKLQNWRRPEWPFSPKTALRREYHGFYVIIVVMTLIKMGTDIIGDGQGPAEWLSESQGWLAFFAVGTLIYVIIRVICKKTQWLVVRGR